MQPRAPERIAFRSSPPRSVAWDRDRPLSVVADWAFEFIGMLSPDGRLLDANRSALDFADVALEEVVGRPFWDTPWWESSPQRDWLRDAVAEAAAGTLARAEVEHLARDGRRIVVDFSLTPLHDESGSVCALVAEGRDLTERKEMEEERHALLAEALSARRAAETAEERAAFLAEAGEVLGTSLDVEATLAHVAGLMVPELATWCCVYLAQPDGSLRCVRATDERPEAQAVLRCLVARTVLTTPPEMPSSVIATGEPQLVAAMDDALLARLAVDDVHLAALRAIGPVSCIAVPLVARGRSLGAIALLRDRSMAPYGQADLAFAMEVARRAAMAVDNAQLYEAACRATRARNDMLGLVSHDLRNPLNAIAMCVEVLLEREQAEPTRNGELLRTIREAADLSHRLIQDLLDVSAIEAGRLSLERRSVDPVLVAVQASELFARPSTQQEITLDLDVPESLPRVNADPERLLQALGNLLGNALKFTPAGGRVGIHGASAGEEVVLSVTDTGPGVPPADVPFIFDRYWHARRTATTSGTGLGLAIVKGIAAAHGGRVWVEAVSGGGSRFSIALPAA